MSKYLVTGAAGFIASRVSEMLLEQGHSVVGVDNLNDAYDVRMKDYRLAKLKTNSDFQFHKLDISSKESIFELDKHGPFDAVINLAARAGVRTSLENPWVYQETNSTGTLNLLDFCKQQKIKKFILASTSSVYGEDALLPTPETATSNLPLQPYAASKISAEVMAHAYHFLYGIDVTVVRYFTVYGSAGRPDMVMFRFAKWLMEGKTLQLNGDGSQTRGFTHVDDIARGTIQALKPVGYEIVNLGGHQSISINELISMMEELIGTEAKIEHNPFHKADMSANHADVSKAKRLLNWQPEIDLIDGVRHMIEWHKENQNWIKDIKTE